MARKKRKSDMPPAELPMTPMIDVVFQLLIYFIVTIKPVDVFAHLDVSRPQAEKTQPQTAVPPKLIRINVFPDGFAINETPVTLEKLDGLLEKLAQLDTTQTILIMCAATSPHEKLIQVLDLCARSRLTNLSVVSTN
jgi:biopolymer transport protein ExbD